MFLSDGDVSKRKKKHFYDNYYNFMLSFSKIKTTVWMNQKTKLK